MFTTKLFILLCALCVVSFIVVMKVDMNAIYQKVIPGSHDPELIQIVIWTSPRLDKEMPFYEKSILQRVADDQNKKPCFHKKYKCEMEMTNDPESLKSADAILFFMLHRGLFRSDLPPSWTSWRRPDQIWIVYAHETPPEMYQSNLPDEVFNWTISYRKDSDVWLPYGRTEPLDSHIQQQSKNDSGEIMIGLNESLSKFISGKSKLVAGVISNCHTHAKREYAIDRMKKTGKPVDIYGKCGNLKVNCSFRLDNCTGFWNNLTRQYKFYLAFENSYCVDYVSEKFWRSLELGMVPVVYGAANYTQLAPPGSFIHVDQFDSAQGLMKYLEKVGENATEYAKYFDWRRNFKLAEGNSWDNGNAWCELCEKLRNFKSNPTVMKTVPNTWWSHMPQESDGYACKEVT